MKKKENIKKIKTSLVFLGVDLLPEGIGRISSYLKKHGLEVSQELLAAKYLATDPSYKGSNLDILNDKPKIIKYLKNTPFFVSKRLEKKLGPLITQLSHLSKFRDFSLVGFSVMSYSQLLVSILLAKSMKKEKEIKIVMGGPMFYSINPSSLLKIHDCIDYIITGEGEVPMLKLLKCLSGDKSVKLAEIGGLTYRKNSKILQNKKESLPINKLPFPDYDETVEYYVNNKKCKRIKNFLITYQVSRGCKNNCLFCNFKGGYAVQLKNPKLIAKDIKKLSKEYGFKNVYLSCNAINLDNNHLRNMCTELIKAGSPVKWQSFARPENLTPELLKLMKKSGCCMLEYGLESGSQRILDDLNKGFTIEEAEKVIRNTKKADILTQVGLLLNTPNEKKEDIIETERFIERNKGYIDFLFIHQFGLKYGSHLHSNQKRLIGKGWDKIRNKPYHKRLFKTIQKNGIPTYGVGYLGKNFINTISSTWRQRAVNKITTFINYLRAM